MSLINVTFLSFFIYLFIFICEQIDSCRRVNVVPGKIYFFLLSCVYTHLQWDEITFSNTEDNTRQTEVH